MADDVTAMDLGTSNTCVTRCSADAAVTVLRPEGWHHSTLGGAIPTLVLYRDGDPFLVGAAAEHEFGEATAAERRSYILRGQFKPDIAARDDARRWMEDFLRLLRSRVAVTDNLLVGIPCQAENHYQQVLRRCLADTGWGNARFLREPMGALLHYIATGALPPSLAARGVLTVDFGGGTCDLAVLRRADVVSRHGDMLYGGRLFDDLFFRMLLERNAGLEDRLTREGNDYYVHWIACRQAKEDFSNAMAVRRDQPVTVRVRWSSWDGAAAREQAAYIDNLTWEEFLCRAGDYRPTPSLLETLREHRDRAGLSPHAEGLLHGKRVDLVSWFEHILLEALARARRDEGLVGADVPMVLLTGGSSAWPFVGELVRQIMGERAQLLVGDEPYADIAKGLAQYHVLAERLREGRAALQRELPAFMEEHIRRRAIRETLDAGVDRLLGQCADLLRNAVLLPEFRRYRDEGGPLRALMARIGEAMRREEPRLRDLLDAETGRLARRVTEACRTELKAWFRSKGIPILPERLEQTWLGVGMSAFLARMGEELSRSTLAPTRAAAETATAVMAPSLAALAASGTVVITPLIAIAMGVAGVVIMRLFHMDRWVVEKALDLPLPGPLRRRIFSEERSAALCDEQLEAFGASFRAQLPEEWSRAEGQILAEAARVAGEEIAALDLLNITPG